jgi:hypothetical protein
MNIYKNVIFSVSLLVISNQLFASDITYPNIFISGTPAVADEVNVNFLVTEIAVDDNNARIVKMESGSVAVHANGFNVPDQPNSNCVDNNKFYLHFPTGSACQAFSSISLPDKSTLNSLSCTAFSSNSAGEAVEVRLHRTNAITGANQVVYTTPATTNNGAVQQLVDTTPLAGTNTVDNARYFYKLEAFFGPTSGGITTRLYGCSVAYTL